LRRQAGRQPATHLNSIVRRQVKRISLQLKQTIISTGAVGGCFGAIAVIAMLLVWPGSTARIVAQGGAPLHWSEFALQLGEVFLTITLGSIILFGLLPAAIGRLLGSLVRRFRGDA
jgi:hypothetical protein